MLLSWCLTALSSFLLCHFELLPMPFVYQADAMGFQAPCPLGFWMLSLSTVASLLLPLASAPWMPTSRLQEDEVHCPLVASTTCFLDVACIHQAHMTT